MLNQKEQPDADKHESSADDDPLAVEMNCLLSELMDTMAVEDEDEIAVCIRRAIQACRDRKLPVCKHFKKVSRSDGRKIIIDWQLSPLACYLIVINCNPNNEQIAWTQLYFAVNRQLIPNYLSS